MQINVNAFDENHINLAEVYTNMAILYAKKKEFEKALEFLEKSKLITINSYGENHHSLENIYYQIGNVYNEIGDKTTSDE